MNFENLISLSNQALRNNKILDAIKILKDAFDENPKSFETCSKLAILLFKIDDLNDSIHYFKKLILLKPEDSLGYSYLGLIYSKLNKTDLAIQNYLKALIIRPENFIANYNLANFYFSINDYQNAEKYYLISIKLKPQHFFTYNNLFQLYDRSNNLKKLNDIYKLALKKFGQVSKVKFLEGLLQFKKKNYKATIEIFKNFSFDEKDFQKNALIMNILAKSYDNLGFYSEAYEYFAKSNNLTKKNFSKKFDKNIFNKQIDERINFISNNRVKKNLNRDIIDDNVDPVFLIGFPRSGTTLLDTILRTHTSIKVLEETILIENLMKKLGDKINNDFSKLYNLNTDNILQLRKSYFENRNELVGNSKKLTYVDKLPLNVIYVNELNIIFPKAKYIFALRNPCDVVLSCFMQPFNINNAMSNFYNLKDTMEFYNLVMSLWDKYQQSLNLDLHIIKYEDVVNNFDNTIKKLIKFLNLEWDDELKNFYITASKRGIINTPSYNQVNSPIYKKSIARWKNYREKFSGINSELEKWINKFQYN
tara:strand:+ start:2678 stop:4279 length:1602 start_codon:yes stop_codon:yes gene_type:complete